MPNTSQNPGQNQSGSSQQNQQGRKDSAYSSGSTGRDKDRDVGNKSGGSTQKNDQDRSSGGMKNE